MREWGGLLSTRIRLISVKDAFLKIVRMCTSVYTAVVLLVADTVRNIPPLSFGVPMNNTAKYRFIIGGLLLSCEDCDKRALNLPRDSR